MRKHWIIGSFTAVAGVAFLYAAAVVAAESSGASVVFLILSLLCGLGIFRVIADASAETPDETPNPWEKSKQTIGLALFGVVAVLFYVSTYVAGTLGLTGFLTLPGVLLTFLALTALVALTGGKVEGEGKRHND